jgi:DNA-binding CsgD family transcriptional regulator
MADLNSLNELLLELNSVFEFSKNDFTIVNSNEKFSSFLNYPSNNLKNKSLREILTDLSFEKLKLSLDSFENGKSELIELEFLANSDSKNKNLRFLFVNNQFQNSNLNENHIRGVLVPEHSKEFALPNLKTTNVEDFKEKFESILETSLQKQPFLENTINEIREASQKLFLTLEAPENSLNLKFSPSELKIINLIREGFLEKEIANFLKISIFTVKKHKQNIRKKLTINNKPINLRTFLSTL